MQLELSKLQADIVKQILQQHIRTVDNHLLTATNLNPKEREVIVGGCKLLKELVRQIEKKEKL
jgi:hypothetical protein